jgi:alpha-galactosidase
MKGINMITKADMEFISRLIPYTIPDEIPLTFHYSNKVIKGIPAEFNPKVYRRFLDSNVVQTVIVGEDTEGLELRAEYIEYRDFPVTEWVAYITNNSQKNTPVLSRIKIMDSELCGTNPVLIYSNGDTCRYDGYEVFTHKITEKITLSPTDGTPCNGAFPYMRLIFDEYSINIAIGWPAQWEVSVAPSENGVIYTAGQQRTNMYLKPGETIRTPGINLMAYTGGEDRGRNIWRRWYFKHILPKENGNPIPPKLCLHTYMIDGKPEFTGITEENQMIAIDTYLSKGLKPDIWWIDAGWYPCNYDWPQTGTWVHDKERLPNGLGPIGQKCEENGIQLLLWFEPERVRPNTWLSNEHPDWLIGEPENPNKLLDLGNPEALDWLINHVDKLIKEYKVNIYRQDFNFAPLPIWIRNEAEDRIGAIENLHVQGYLKFWDELILRNPGLWIDSCASGGRRNDLETMRRAVPLHYTDMGYGEHPIKQKQHRLMFEWIPYFRAHTMSWDNENGEYVRNVNQPVDDFAYHCAMAPAITSMIEYYDNEELFDVGRKFDPIWRAAAEYMLTGDYYPLTECRKSPEDYYSMQFDDATRNEGFIQVLRNIHVKEDSITVYPFVDEKAIYHFENRETGETMTISGSELKNGFTVSIPKRSAVIWFYKKEMQKLQYRRCNTEGVIQKIWSE